MKGDMDKVYALIVDIHSKVSEMNKHFNQQFGGNRKGETRETSEPFRRQATPTYCEDRFKWDPGTEQRYHTHYAPWTQEQENIDDGDVAHIRKTKDSRIRNQSLLKLKAYQFSGTCSIEEYFDWEERMDQIFESYDYPKNRESTIVASQLRGDAQSWWYQERNKRGRYFYVSNPTWAEIKDMMRRRYTPHQHSKRKTMAPVPISTQSPRSLSISKQPEPEKKMDQYMDYKINNSTTVIKKLPEAIRTKEIEHPNDKVLRTKPFEEGENDENPEPEPTIIELEMIPNSTQEFVGGEQGKTDGNEINLTKAKLYKTIISLEKQMISSDHPNNEKKLKRFNKLDKELSTTKLEVKDNQGQDTTWNGFLIHQEVWATQEPTQSDHDQIRNFQPFQQLHLFPNKEGDISYYLKLIQPEKCLYNPEDSRRGTKHEIMSRYKGDHTFHLWSRSHLMFSIHQLGESNQKIGVLITYGNKVEEYMDDQICFNSKKSIRT